MDQFITCFLILIFEATQERKVECLTVSKYSRTVQKEVELVKVSLNYLSRMFSRENQRAEILLTSALNQLGSVKLVVQAPVRTQCGSY